MPVFLLTDVEGSTRLWDAQAEAMSRALERHDEIIVDAIHATGGEHKRSRGEGDSHFAVFESPRDAVACALAIQQAMAAEPWPDGARLRVRIGIHSGPVEEREGEYYGTTVNRAARLRAIAHGGQTVMSSAVATAAVPPDGVSFRDHGAHRLKDLEEPERVFEMVFPGLEEDFPPLLSLDEVRHNLPVQMTSFIGREEEVLAATKALEASRLVTLVGTGGLGKTRLALQVAADAIDGYPDGVWFVDLAPVTDAGLVPAAVLSALRARTDDSTLEALVEVLRSRRTLLVLDNCEQVISGAAAAAASVLAGCPDTAMIATSREPLNVPGERVVRVPALSTPEEDDDPLAAVYPAVQLFVERAMSARDDFVLDARTTGPVVRICRRLDGVPLAIELAAARVNVLSPHSIDERLDDRFRVLTRGPRTVDQRQRTLRDTVEWSHELLDDAERTLFRRLAVFVGGFTLDAAEHVCAAGAVETYDVLDLLSALVDKSLVVADHTGEVTRYRMLETIAAYARERLEGSGELAQMRDAHLRYYAELMRQLSGTSQPEMTPEALAQATREVDNLRAAADHALEADPSAGLAIMWHSTDVWELGHVAEAAERFRAFLDAHPDRDVQRLYGLGGYATMLGSLGRTAEALAAADEAIDIARERKHNERLAASLVARAVAQKAMGALAAAYESLVEAESVARTLHAPQTLAYALTAKASLLLETDVDAAIGSFEEALRIRREGAFASSIRNVLALLANAYESAGRLSEARAAAFESREMARSAEDDTSVMYATTTLGRIALAEGDGATARAELEAGLAIAEELSMSLDAGVAHALLGELARSEEDLDRARFHYDRASDAFERCDSVIGAAFVRNNVAHLELARGHLDAARALGTRALRVAVEAGFESGVVEFLELLAEVDAASGAHERALRTFGAAEALRDHVGVKRDLVDQADYDRGVDAARAAAGEQADALWSAGRDAGADTVAAELLAGSGAE